MRYPFWIVSGFTLASLGSTGCGDFSLDAILGSDCEVEVDDECIDDLFSDDDNEDFFDGLSDLFDDND